MRPSSFGFLVAIASFATISVATLSRAGGLSDLVGYGAQDVYLNPPAAAPAAPASAPEAPVNAAEANGQNDAGGATAHQTWKPKLRLSKDCRKAGIKTQEECDAFHTAQANKPADPSQPANASTGQTPAASAGNPSVLRITNGMGGTAYSN